MMRHSDSDPISPASTGMDAPGMRITWPVARAFLRRYALMILGVFALTVLSTYAAISMMTERYEARAALLVKIGRETLDPPPTARNGMLVTGLRREDIASEVQILTAPDLLAQAVDEIGLDAFRGAPAAPQGLVAQVKYQVKRLVRGVRAQYQEALIALDLKKRLSERDAVIEELRALLVVEPEKGSDIIAMRLRYPDPALAVAVQEALIGHYLERRREVRPGADVQTFLADRSATLREGLHELEQRRDDLKRVEALTDPAEQKSLLLRQIRELSATRDESRAEVTALEQQIGLTEPLVSQSAAMVEWSRQEMPSPALSMLKEELAKLEASRAGLVTRYDADSQAVLNLDREIAGLRALRDRAEASEAGIVTTQANPVRQRLEERLQQDRILLEGAQARLALQDQQLGQLQGQLQRLERADASLIKIERERQLAETNYMAHVRREQEAELAAALDASRISNVSVAAPPAATLVPVYPPKLLIMGLSLVVGLVLGFALALLVEWTDDRVRSPMTVRSATRLKYLGAVPAGSWRDPGAAA